MPKLGQTKKNAKPRTKRERKYDGTPERKKARAERNRARNVAKKKGLVRVGDGKVVDHKKSISKNGIAKARSGGTKIQSQKASNKQGGKMSKKMSKKKK